MKPRHRPLTQAPLFRAAFSRYNESQFRLEVKDKPTLEERVRGRRGRPARIPCRPCRSGRVILDEFCGFALKVGGTVLISGFLIRGIISCVPRDTRGDCRPRTEAMETPHQSAAKPAPGTFQNRTRAAFPRRSGYRQAAFPRARDSALNALTSVTTTVSEVPHLAQIDEGLGRGLLFSA